MADIHSHSLAPARARTGEDALIPFLLEARNKPIEISVANVPRLDTYRLQLLLVAQKQWQQDRVAFSVTGISESFRGGLARLGLDTDHFERDLVQ